MWLEKLVGAYGSAKQDMESSKIKTIPSRSSELQERKSCVICTWLISRAEGHTEHARMFRFWFNYELDVLWRYKKKGVCHSSRVSARKLATRSSSKSMQGRTSMLGSLPAVTPAFSFSKGLKNSMESVCILRSSLFGEKRFFRGLSVCFWMFFFFDFGVIR